VVAERFERSVELCDDEIEPLERSPFEFFEVFAELMASLAHRAKPYRPVRP
jgi:hypothetical protein